MDYEWGWPGQVTPWQPPAQAVLGVPRSLWPKPWPELRADPPVAGGGGGRLPAGERAAGEEALVGAQQTERGAVGGGLAISLLWCWHDGASEIFHRPMVYV